MKAESQHTPSPEREDRPKPKVAIVGTGSVGRNIAKGLEERDFPVQHIVFFGSKRSAGETIGFRGEPHEIRELNFENIRGFDLVFMAATNEVSREWSPLFAKQPDCTVIDVTSEHRMTAPLIVPEVNGHLLRPTGPESN